MLLQWLFNLNSNFLKKTLLWSQLSMVKIDQLKLGLMIWWLPALYARCYIPFGERVHPSVTNDDYLWSLNKGYLWRLLQRTQQFDLMDDLTVSVSGMSYIYSLRLIFHKITFVGRLWQFPNNCHWISLFIRILDLLGFIFRVRGTRRSSRRPLEAVDASKGQPTGR